MNKNVSLLQVNETLRKAKYGKLCRSIIFILYHMHWLKLPTPALNSLAFYKVGLLDKNWNLLTFLWAFGVFQLLLCFFDFICNTIKEEERGFREECDTFTTETRREPTEAKGCGEDDAAARWKSFQWKPDLLPLQRERESAHVSITENSVIKERARKTLAWRTPT